VSGYGQTGPYSQRAGYGGIGEAMGGLRYIVGEPDRPPARVGISIGDSLAAVHACMGALAALHHREHTGSGQVVDAAIYESVLNMMESLITEFDQLGHVRERSGAILPRIAPSNVYPTRDGIVMIGANQDTVFARFCEAMGRADVAGDPRFASTTLRAKNQAPLKEIVEAESMKFSAQEMIARFRAAGVPCAPINTYSSVLEDEQVRHMQWVQEIALPSGKKTRTFGSPLRFTGKGFPVRRDPPALGQHNDEIYRGLLGLGDVQLAMHRDAGVI
jgi:formyl-CoA transferase